MLSLLQQYDVDYVFVGATERGEGSAAGAYPEERGNTPGGRDIQTDIVTRIQVRINRYLPSPECRPWRGKSSAP